MKNAIESAFSLITLMVAGGDFVNKINNWLFHAKCREMRLRSSTMAVGSHFVMKNAILHDCSEMATIAIEIHFRSSKVRGGGGHHNGQPVYHLGIYTVFALGQIHQF